MTYEEVIGIIKIRMRDLKDGYENYVQKVIKEISNSSPSDLQFPNSSIDELKYHACSYCELEFIYDMLTNEEFRNDYLSDLTDEERKEYNLTNL